MLLADLQRQPIGHCCLLNMCWSLDTPCVSGARENERTADGRLAVWREMQPGLSYYFTIPRSIFYSLVPRLKVLWLVRCVIKKSCCTDFSCRPAKWQQRGWGQQQAMPLLDFITRERSCQQLYPIANLLYQHFRKPLQFQQKHHQQQERKTVSFFHQFDILEDKRASRNRDDFAAWQARPATANWQKFPWALLSRLLFPHAESFNANIWLGFKEAKSSIQPCSGSTHMLQISSVPLFVPPIYWPCLGVTHTARILSLSSSSSFTVLIFQRRQTTWRARELSGCRETVSWNYPLGSLRFCSPKCSWRHGAKGQQGSQRGCCEFRRLLFIPLPGPDALKVTSEIALKI